VRLNDIPGISDYTKNITHS